MRQVVVRACIHRGIGAKGPACCLESDSYEPRIGQMGGGCLTKLCLLFPTIDLRACFISQICVEEVKSPRTYSQPSVLNLLQIFAMYRKTLEPYTQGLSVWPGCAPQLEPLIDFINCMRISHLRLATFTCCVKDHTPRYLNPNGPF